MNLTLVELWVALFIGAMGVLRSLIVRHAEQRMVPVRVDATHRYE